MPNYNIDDLAVAGTITGVEFVEFLQSGINKKVAVSALANYIGSLATGYQGIWNYALNADADPSWTTGQWGETDDGRGSPGDIDYVQPGAMIFKISTGLKYL
jgi:hypothetical protein